MNQLEKLFDRIIGKVKISLRESNFDAKEYLKYLQDYIPLRQLVKFYAFYGVTARHPFNFHFNRSNLAGSYFLGNCTVDNAILYKSDIRGDENSNLKVIPLIMRASILPWTSMKKSGFKTVF
jgi:hypothetical protein